VIENELRFRLLYLHSLGIQLQATETTSQLEYYCAYSILYYTESERTTRIIRIINHCHKQTVRIVPYEQGAVHLQQIGP